MPEITLRRLIDRYALLLLDIYGVLTTGTGPCPSAAELLVYLNQSGKPYLLLTNDASRSPQAVAERLQRFDLAVTADRVITAGSLLTAYFAQHSLQGSRCAVLGTEDSRAYVAQAGGQIIALADDAVIDVLAVCDDAGFPFLKGVNAALTMVFRAIDQGRPLHLVLPNPDLIFPRTQSSYGITAGSIALIIEQAIAVRYPQRPLQFARLGKPHRPLFERALIVGGTRDMLMIGDQLATDILGAQRFGIDSLLISQGVTSPAALTAAASIRPTYVLSSLALDYAH
jgi:HAD superfamily hydrolase (TIGR01450 family)